MGTQTWTPNKISKIKLGETTYLVKDATARAITDTYELNNGAGTRSAATTISASSTDAVVPTASAVKSYITTALAGVTVLEYKIVETLPTASSETMNKIYAKLQSGSSTTYDEFVTIYQDSTYSWVQIGTSSSAVGKYVTTVTYDSTAHELKATHGNGTTTTVTLGAFADANGVAGTGSVETADSITLNTVSLAETDATVAYATATATITPASYTPAGSVSGRFTASGSVTDISIGATTSAMTVETTTITPTGTISVTHGKDTQADAKTITTISYAPEGEVSFTLKNNTFDVIDSNGTVATVTGTDSFTQPTFSSTSASGNTQGYTATVSETDETLTFGDAPTVSAISSVSFTNSTYTKGTFVSNVMPSITSHALGFTASFTGTTADDIIISAPKFDRYAISSVTFNGDTKTVVSGAKYTKSEGNGTTASFTGSEATFSGLGFTGDAANVGVSAISYEHKKANPTITATFIPVVNIITKGSQTVSVTDATPSA